MPVWTLYSRPDCSLCEQMIAELAELLSPAEAAQVRIVDISQDAALDRKYGLRIPVLTADDEVVCGHRLDRDRVRSILAAGRS